MNLLNTMFKTRNYYVYFTMPYLFITQAIMHRINKKLFGKEHFTVVITSNIWNGLNGATSQVYLCHKPWNL